jgi:hypothetical protein
LYVVGYVYVYGVCYGAYQCRLWQHFFERLADRMGNRFYRFPAVIVFFAALFTENDGKVEDMTL